jgi:hypothetical protein
MEIELLVVPDCPHEAAADIRAKKFRQITTAVAETGVQATVTHTVITSQDQARRRGFAGSPTILVNGSDPFEDPAAPAAMACRLYPTPEGLRGVPALRDLRRALKRVAEG